MSEQHIAHRAANQVRLHARAFSGVAHGTEGGELSVSGGNLLSGDACWRAFTTNQAPKGI